MNYKIIDTNSTINNIKINKNDLTFIVSKLPHIPDNEDLGKPAMFSGQYIAVSLLSYSMKTYIIKYDDVPMGYEYFMEKFELDEEPAAALTIAICNLIGRESRAPEKYEVKYRFVLNRFKKLK